MKNKKLLIGIAALVLLLLGGAVYFWIVCREPARGGFQAVFLDNGQVYFGKITGDGEKNIILTDIYYLQANKPLQAGDIGSQPDLALVKLGNELHGPVDRMEINREHVLFVEDMKPDSKVVKAINDYKSKK